MEFRYLLTFVVVTPYFLFSQKIDNVISYRDISSTDYIRFSFDNDFFTSTDRNYTGGYNFEIVSPKLVVNPINYLLLKPHGSNYKYGLAFEQIVYTPNDIESTEVQFGDRPYAVAVMLKSFLISIDSNKNSRLSSSFNFGLIGPGAFGKEIQTAIHKLTGNTVPRGWVNQVQNNVVLNYEVSYEKQIVRRSNFFSLQGNSTVRLGTLFTNAALGVNATLGMLNSPFSPVNQDNRLQIYVFTQIIGSIIGYDATLQGGIFDSSCCYTISKKSIERFTAQCNYGLVIQKGNSYLEYSMSSITREFETGISANWGGIKFGFKF